MEGTSSWWDDIWNALFARARTPKERIAKLREQLQTEVYRADDGVACMQNQASQINRDLDKLIERGRDERLQLVKVRQLAIYDNAIAEAYQAQAQMQQVLLQIQAGEATAQLGDMIAKGEQAIRAVNIALDQPKRAMEIQQFGVTMVKNRTARDVITDGVDVGLTAGVEQASDLILRKKLDERKLKIMGGTTAAGEMGGDSAEGVELDRRLKAIKAGK